MFHLNTVKRQQNLQSEGLEHQDCVRLSCLAFLQHQGSLHTCTTIRCVHHSDQTMQLLSQLLWNLGTATLKSYLSYTPFQVSFSSWLSSLLLKQLWVIFENREVKFRRNQLAQTQCFALFSSYSFVPSAQFCKLSRWTNSNHLSFIYAKN